MNKDEALKMAIEWIEGWYGDNMSRDAVLNACKEALEQPAQDTCVHIGMDKCQYKGICQHCKQPIIEFLKDKQICAFDNYKLQIQSWINELEGN